MGGILQVLYQGPAKNKPQVEIQVDPVKVRQAADAEKDTCWFDRTDKCWTRWPNGQSYSKASSDVQ